MNIIPNIIILIICVILLWEIFNLSFKYKKIKNFIPLIIFISTIILKYNFFIFEISSIIFDIIIYALISYAIFSILLLMFEYKMKNKNLYNKKLSFWKKKVIVMLGDILIFISLIFIIMNIATTENKFSETNELIIYDWMDYYAPDIISDFEKETGINVQVYTYEEEYEMFYELQNGGEYDLAFASNSLINELINKELIKKIDAKKLTNYKNLDESLILENSYGIPYTWGTTGLLVNKNHFEEIPDSWSVLWNKKYSEKVFVMNNPDELIYLIGFFISGKPIPGQRSEFLLIEEFFSLLSKNVLILEESEISEMFKSEEIWAGQFYNGAAAKLISENSNYTYVLPEEGYSLWIDYLIMPSSGKNHNNAYLFLDYILRPEVSAKIVEYQHFASANYKAKEYLDEEILLDKTIYIPDDLFSKNLLIDDDLFSKNYVTFRNQFFNKIQYERLYE